MGAPGGGQLSAAGGPNGQSPTPMEGTFTMLSSNQQWHALKDKRLVLNTYESPLKIYKNKREIFVERPETPQQQGEGRIRERVFIIAKNKPIRNLWTQRALREKAFFWG